VLVKRSDRVL